MTFRKLVTCPETAHLEQIEYDDHPLGMLIVRCSRYGAKCPLECPRTCAARLDRRDKGRTEPNVICASADDTEHARRQR